MKVYLGVDVGSVSTNLVLMDDNLAILDDLYLRTNGRPIEALQKGVEMLRERWEGCAEVCAVGTTGSGRRLAAAVLGADTVKNEITAHAVAALQEEPAARTVIEIGGQDSKIIILRDGVVADFSMNTVCAAGTGSFLDQQASRLNLPVEEFGRLALQANNPVRIAGRCSVFAESDMIHKQQMGHNLPDIISGLCEALVRNYLSNVGKGKEMLAPVVFQGGVAANEGMREALKKALGTEVIVPLHFRVMGAIGAALLCREIFHAGGESTKFKGFDVSGCDFKARSFECSDCANLCEIIEITENGFPLARWGGRCGKWGEAENQVQTARKETGCGAQI